MFRLLTVHRYSEIKLNVAQSKGYVIYAWNTDTLPWISADRALLITTLKTFMFSNAKNEMSWLCTCECEHIKVKDGSLDLF